MPQLHAPVLGTATPLTSPEKPRGGQSTGIHSDLQCLLEMYVGKTLDGGSWWARGPGTSGHVKLLLGRVFCREGLLPQTPAWEEIPRTWSSLLRTESSSGWGWSGTVW